MLVSDCPNMSMKPGATAIPVRVDGALGGHAFQVSDGGNFASADGDIARVPGRAGAVDDVAVADDYVVGIRGGGEKEYR